jgi:hypothetical protein
MKKILVYKDRNRKTIKILKSNTKKEKEKGNK